MQAEAARLRIMFFGTPDFAATTLRELLDGPDTVVGVVCQPDRPSGRSQKLQEPPVKVLAESRRKPVLQPAKVRTEEFLESLRAWRPDVGVVVAYGRILPRPVLDLPRLGFINVHASLLPKYRGAAPIQWAIVRGEPVTGVTIMQMNERMDEGDILMQRETPIAPDETYGALQERLARLGAEALRDALLRLHGGNLTARPQDPAAATLAPLIRKEEGAIDWTAAATRIACRVRGFHPWPSAFTRLDGRLLKVHRARSTEGASGPPAGTVVAVGESIDVSTGSGLLRIDEIQLEGRKRLLARDFVRGGGISVGQRLGNGRTDRS